MTRNHNRTTCLICDKLLTGKQTVYCSNRCKCVTSNAKIQDYKCQRKRGIQRRLALLDKLGNKCSVCGYNKNTAALCFHHLRDKCFPITLRECSNNSQSVLDKEVEKCILLCSNCHQELHHPDCAREL